MKLATSTPRCLSQPARRLAVGLIALAAVAGCAPQPQPAEEVHEPAASATDTAIVDSISDSGVRKAIIVQHCLFPYHFVPGGEMLDELGQRDLAVLISHYRSVGGGDLSVRRDDTPDELYNARVQRVRQVLRLGGVDMTAIRIVDAPPGGDGIASTDALRAHNRDANQSAYQPADMTRSGMDTGNGGTSSPAGARP